MTTITKHRTSPAVSALLIAAIVTGLLIFLLNALTTFSYGFAVVGPFLLVDVFGPYISALLSGLMTVLLFDIAYALALLTLILACRSILQYAIVGLQFAITLILSLSASIVAILLLSPLSSHLSTDLLELARYAGYTALLIGFTVNILATIGYIIADPAVSRRLKEAIRSAKHTAVADTAANALDDQTTALANDEIMRRVPQLAQLQADQLLRAYLAREGFDPARLPSDFFREAGS